MPRRLPTPLLLLVSFIEGAAVMVIELLGAKAIAPYYGTSLYVWASVLGVTIGALALGYFSGGSISRRYPAERSLFVILLLAAACTLLTPWIAPTLLPATEALGLRAGSLLAVLFYLLPAVACLGAVSPVIIQLINRDVTASGQSAGTVYAISTAGGILATLLAGFYLIPEAGLRLTALLTGGVLGATGLAYFAFFNRGAGTATPATPASAASAAMATGEATGEAAAAALPAGALPARILLAVAFIEGGAVMVMELLGAKITAPYYGTSLYVWSAVLAVTLGALALGYFAGGWLSRRHPGERTLFRILLVAGFLTATAPLIAPTVFLVTHFLGVRVGSLVSVLIYLLPAVACMGMVTPQITQMLSRRRDEAGQSAGNVYGISTVGGILATFLAGFYLIPELGIRTTALLAGGLLGVLAIAWFARARDYATVVAGLVLAGVTVLMHPTPPESPNARVLYSSSGILGQWTVIDYGRWQEEGGARLQRRLLLNGIDQTATEVGFEPLSLWTYPHKIGAYASLKPKGAKALLLGMGGGSIAYGMKMMGLDLDIVELDARIEPITRAYFGYDPVSSRMFVDDARHYIRSTADKYDVVVIDLLIGEVQPTHVFSLEGFADLKRILNEGALVIINFQGNMSSPGASVGPRSIYKTLKAAGFFVNYYTLAESEEATRDIFFLASLQQQDFRQQMAHVRYNDWHRSQNFGYDDLIREDEPVLDDAFVLTDDKPKLELLNATSILEWRKNKVAQNMRPLLQSGMDIY